MVNPTLPRSYRILNQEADSDAVRPVRSTVLKEIQLDLQVWGCWGHNGGGFLAFACA